MNRNRKEVENQVNPKVLRVYKNNRSEMELKGYIAVGTLFRLSEPRGKESLTTLLREEK